MQGKILIIDGISTNRIVLKVKLTAAFYQVVQAGTMAEALQLVQDESPDLVLTALNLPDGTAAELCQKLQSIRRTAMIPVLAIGCTTNTQTRLDILRAGAFDVMQKPVNETLLLGRVRTMLRMHHSLAEWQMRDDTSEALGLAEPPAEFIRPSSITLIGTNAAPLQGWVRQMVPQMRARYTVTLLRDALASLHAGPPPDAVVLDLPHVDEQTEDCLHLISALRASAQTRNIALIVVQKKPDPIRATSTLDMGANDVMIHGFNAAELAVRLRLLLRCNRQIAQLLQTVRTGLREVVNDPLTGLYNRRYAMPFMSRLIESGAASDTPFAIILADMDHFKQINDIYGHASGDAVLVETARRLRATLRDTDMVARIGGEEFLIAMPATDVTTARQIADRLCDAIGGRPFAIPGAHEPVRITVSLGLAMGAHPMSMDRGALEAVDPLLDRADKALYAAKTLGRNCVKMSQPAARPAA